MSAPAVLALVMALAVPTDTVPMARDSVIGPVQTSLASAVRTVQDTIPRRRRAIEVSEWYERRLRIHRYGAYAIFPLFAAQALAGNEIFKDPHNAPDWAKTTHRVGATGLATIFTLNTVTGLWNLWDSRAATQGRTSHGACTPDARFRRRLHVRGRQAVRRGREQRGEAARAPRVGVRLHGDGTDRRCRGHTWAGGLAR
jgi:hypothetical protein